ncbi:uncharacterized protein CcaverHIS019_0101420 [Cutaneotrichosporon cavernicola]|uniref:BZIP domain-containing protein n=1 Tax=Cutaneotrichosporon cavernicola TaxID=279322 RepID=A0AA48KWR1_9TREE|nr:uncharacterized protein CcaverHIS019_0101420 [Cutaneotrichosporon cavernicola]BEI87424.1 hypothetical protein CcaverHIS019_0101420 [Cutaneotrichosporon cavernicola]
MPNDSGTPDGRNWDAILAAFSRSGAGRPAEPSDWGVPGPGPSSQTEASPAPSTDLLAHFTHQLLLQQQQQLQAYSGYPPEYVALLQASNQALQTSRAQSQNNSPSSLPRSARGSISGTPAGTPSATPITGTPIAPAPASFSSLSNLAPTPTGRPPPNTSPIADPSGGLSTAALTPAGLDDTEDKRVRNTLASARFRAKKKAHVENVERNIRALEAQHSELEVQVADLRKENGLLKEMVQLKYGGVKNG